LHYFIEVLDKRKLNVVVINFFLRMKSIKILMKINSFNGNISVFIKLKFSSFKIRLIRVTNYANLKINLILNLVLTKNY
jgi:hypothetical protein